MSQNSIPASWIVAINPSVIGAGGNPLSLNTVVLTNETSIPIGTVKSFSSANDVSQWFGPSSDEARIASVYFLGFSISSIKPGTIYFAQYPSTDVAAYVRSGDLSGMTLTALKLLSGTLIVTMDGVEKTSSSINLSTVGSFSDAATAISSAFTTGPVCTYDSLRHGFVLTSGTTGVTSTMSAVSGTMAAGLYFTEALGAVSSPGANAAITPATSAVLYGGTLGSLDAAGLKLISGTLSLIVDGHLLTSDTLDFSGVSVLADGAAIIEAAFTDGPTVTYNSSKNSFDLTSTTTGEGSNIGACTGTAATALAMTVATDAIAVQGEPAKSNPAATMDTITGITQNWASFMSVWEPDLDGKEAFRTWSASKGDRYLYVSHDSDVSALGNNATGTFGNICKANNYSNVQCVWPDSDAAAFVCGAYASVDYNQTNGKTVLAGKSSSLLTPMVTDQTTADNLIGNGYSFYCAVATANTRFTFWQDGNMPGPWTWGDNYMDQIYMSDQMALYVLTLMANTKSLPHNKVGAAMVYNSLLTPIKQFVGFGAIQANTVPSEEEIAIVNQEAGVDISGPLQNQGWYLQIGVASAQQRALRASPPCNFWYMMGQSIQRLTIPSYAVQ